MNKIFDKNICLNEENHEYRLLKIPDFVFISVTTFVDGFFEGFDAPKIALSIENRLILIK